MPRLLLSWIFLVALAAFGSSLQAADKQVSDDVIYNNVIRKLATDDTVKGGALDVDVKEGAVTLKGNVNSEKKKEKAEKIARKVSGVKDVDNQIKVVVQ